MLHTLSVKNRYYLVFNDYTDIKLTTKLTTLCIFNAWGYIGIEYFLLSTTEYLSLSDYYHHYYSLWWTWNGYDMIEISLLNTRLLAAFYTNNNPRKDACSSKEVVRKSIFNLNNIFELFESIEIVSNSKNIELSISKNNGSEEKHI